MHRVFIFSDSASIQLRPPAFPSRSKRHINVRRANRWPGSSEQRNRDMHWNASCILSYFYLLFIRAGGNVTNGPRRHIFTFWTCIQWTQTALMWLKWGWCREQRKDCSCVCVIEREKGSPKTGAHFGNWFNFVAVLEVLFRCKGKPIDISYLLFVWGDQCDVNFHVWL